jgi:TrmH family RNA methyltransferase
MISKQQAKFVKSLKLKKYRRKASSFLVEGAKNVEELLLADYEVKHLFVTDRFLEEYPQFGNRPFELCTEKDLVSIGTFQSNEYALAVAAMREGQFEISKVRFALALDNVSDPGNLGTIVRIADWYGIDTILAGTGTADFYNPKVINASMGSFTRVSMHYVDLEQFFKENESHSIYGTMLDGVSIHDLSIKLPAIVLMGNESSGISETLMPYIHERITIPKKGGAESLNVAVSTAIICDNLLRK